MVKRLPVSINDELADWVETQASERGVSQAKAVRDALTTERERLSEHAFKRHVVKQAFDRIESTGDGEQLYLEEDGLAMHTT